MTREKIMTELFEFSSPTYYKWTKQDKRKIFDLLNYAFTNNQYSRSEPDFPSTYRYPP